jgi:hypothetical protein
MAYFRESEMMVVILQKMTNQPTLPIDIRAYITSSRNLSYMDVLAMVSVAVRQAVF